MRGVYKIAAALLIAASSAGLAYADNDTEFGVEDDLTVLGTGGSAADPDLEVKGFTVFGATQAAPLLQIPVAPGNIFANGYVQVSSGMYVAGNSTFTAYGIFQSTVTMIEGNLKYGTAVSGKVLKSGGNGYVYWGDDTTGITSLNGTPYNIRMEDAAGTGLADSLLIQNPASTNITLINGSSMTVTGEFGVGGLTRFNGNMTAAAYGIFQSTVQFTGNTGALTNLYFDNAAANVGRVLKASANGFLYWGSDATGLSTLGSPYRLQMVNSAGDGLVDSMFIQNAGATNITMIAGSSMTFNGAMNTTANVQLGDSTGDNHGVNRAPEAGVAMAVDGSGTSGTYAAKFYSNGSLAAWIKKK
ncbi:MAG: hypothetical protein HY952_01225 [Elusimicrobia bacterium]|nr:hypothetical protein [Elusimicrobiota bacterium]